MFWLTVQEDDLAVSSYWIGLVDQVTIETRRFYVPIDYMYGGETTARDVL